MIDYILFDMDNCLYPASSGLCSRMDGLISNFVAELLSLPVKEAEKMRRENVLTYGTTLKWLTDCHDFKDIHEYNRHIHPADVENYLKKETGIKEMLESLPCGKSVLTNAPPVHADRVLNYLGISGLFDEVLYLGFSGTMGKPHRETYLRAAEICGCSIADTLFLDDVPDYLIPFRDEGGEILLVDETRKHSGRSLPSITNIMELPGYIKECFNV
ncbi:MAG: HAD hydrolase-like protein [Spirochaetales bacterium]|nr:HAD hydrolase-like protein [Spirochaetales bacterium]